MGGNRDVQPIVGITMGDASGIGPEIIVKALSLKEIYDLCRPIVIGDLSVMREAVKLTNVGLGLNKVLNVDEALFNFGVIDVLDLGNIDLNRLKVGQVDEMSGRASVQYIIRAVDLAMRGEIDAIATAPINKEAINRAGYNYSGHTELLADLTKTKEYTMLLIAGNLRVTHVTTHVSMREACKLVKKERILKTIELTNKALINLGIEKPRIGVAALNPHGGEGGLFGREEIEEIRPAVEEARKMGINVDGPIPADTIFVKAKGGMFDAVVAMYHDQGHIPIKLLGLEWNEAEKKWASVRGVNITVGLPIIRTSVDHGTAFGKAWKGRANPQSMIEAIKFAAKLAKLRFKTKITW